MDHHIQNFAFEDTLVRAVMIDGATWFVGTDVCRVLAIKNSRDAMQRLDDDEKQIMRIDTASDKARARDTVDITVVSEPGLYRLIFSSRKAEAERFKSWVAREVLPAIRKHGYYSINQRPAPQANGQPFVFTTDHRNAIKVVRESRLTFGNAYARHIWAKSVLPDVD